jgi:hypothetical protein
MSHLVMVQAEARCVCWELNLLCLAWPIFFFLFCGEEEKNLNRFFESFSLLKSLSLTTALAEP